MSNIIQPNYGARTYGVHTMARKTEQNRTHSSSFIDLISRAIIGTTDVPEISIIPTETTTVDTYMEHLKSKYGRVTIESIGRDQASLQKAGGHMSGNDVVIAPNILEDMASDPKKAVYYEQKIDYFFNTVVPQGNAICAAQGLVFEPCGVVVHEDGTVTYICGCSDSPERVAEVNRINREKDAKKVAQQKEYQEQSAAAAAERRAMWERTAQARALGKSFYNIGDLLKAQMVSVPTVTGTNMFFLNF